MNLVIVESPTKAKTIAKFLGTDYIVKASYGHVVDLPTKTLGVDLTDNFKPEYVVTVRGKKTLTELKKLARDAEVIYIATDPDREGEAIGFNLLEQIKSEKSKVPAFAKASADRQIPNSNYKRIQFHEITKEAIEAAVKHPTEINVALVEAQQARRVLDRLVGYKLSPLLWKKVRYGLSAGRVQSVAVRLIVERERERKKFKAQEYWEFEGKFNPRGTAPAGQCPNFGITAGLRKINGKDFLIDSKEKAAKIVSQVNACGHKVESVDKKEVRKYPHPPFTTSTLQQSAGNLFGFSAKRTMSAAQKLYEEGFITYHRTDSLNLSESFINEARVYIGDKFGKNFLPEKPIFYKTKSKSAQEAHEAIRPTAVGNFKFETLNFKSKSKGKLSKLVKSNQSDQGDKLDKSSQYDADLEKIYDLIWRRAVSCQMTPAVYDQVTVCVISKWGTAPLGQCPDPDEFLFVSSEQVLKFQGFLVVYHSGSNHLPSTVSFLPPTPYYLSSGQILDLTALTPSQHFTQAPGRYQTASLIKALEEYGVGRPSTYASTITTIESRGYVLRDGRYFYPDDVAYVVNDLLVANFPEVVDLKFTAKMEEELDKIAEGTLKWGPVIRDFWDPFVKDLEKAETNLKKSYFTTLETVEEKCPDCGANLVVKLGKYGKFLSCSKFPECKYMKALVQETGDSCPDCKEGRVVLRRTKKGKPFYGCSRYPDCKWASWTKPTSEG